MTDLTREGLVELRAAAAFTDADTPDLEGVEGIDYLGAMAVEALDEFPVLRRRCIACAYTAGTEASQHPVTSAVARNCVERSHPFFCHKAEDRKGFKTHLCAGWGEGIRARAMEAGRATTGATDER